MNILSSPSSTSKLTLFSPAQNPDSANFHLYTFRILHASSHYRILLPLHSHESSSSSSWPPILQEKPRNSAPDDKESEIEDEGGSDEEIITAKMSLEELLVVRRPVMEFLAEESEAGSSSMQKEPESVSAIDERLSRFAKSMPIFEPEKVESSARERPLMVNLDLALYKAKVLTRNYRFAEAEEILVKCINYWPEDGRPYVALGKTFGKQSKMDEARAVYEKGCQATQGENSFIWQCWAVFESKMGNIGRSRELFDAATVADKKHVAAWHGWAVLEMKQGNVKKARSLLGRALKYCGGNEYVYQTLALLEVKGKRYDQARHLFRQATKCNPKSCASWLAWAQLEAQLENLRAARSYFEKAVQASPKNRFAWHVWGVFEANLGNADLARKLLKVGHTVNPRDPVLLQSLALLEYRYSTANLARAIFLKASELDPSHQPVWIAWGWMEWKEGNSVNARELYQKALSINSTTESAARCLQAWGVLEQRAGNLSAARRLFRSSLNVNSQSYVTWMTWAALEEDQGNSERAEEIRNLYFQQRTEVTDEGSWMVGFMDIIDPAVDSIKRLLNMEKPDDESLMGNNSMPGDDDNGVSKDGLNSYGSGTGFDLDEFIREKLLLDPSKLEVQLGPREGQHSRNAKSVRNAWRFDSRKNGMASPKL